jgi:putative aldouronate transport system permease protein
MKTKRKKMSILNIFIYLILILAALSCTLPFIHILALSFSSSSAVASGKVVFWPVDFTTFSYEFALKGGKFFRAMSISIQRVALGSLINLVMCILTAYPLSKPREQFMGRDIYMLYFFITCLVGGGLVPTYLVVARLGLKDSLWALILPGALPIANMIILMNFIRGLPKELEEAAMIDGAGKFQTLIKIMLPLLKPSLATITLFHVVGHWNDWFSGMIYMNDIKKYPLYTYLQTLLVSFEELMSKSDGLDYVKIVQLMNARTGRAAQLFLGMIPVLMIYPFLQKYFTQGLTLGTAKG